MEIERKFLIKNLNEIDINKYKSKQIIQDYLYADEFTAIRKRKIITNDAAKYKYTIKTEKTNYSVNELEKDITEKEYNDLVTNKNYHTISKKRYIIPYLNDLVIELDVFEGDYTGIIFAEIEFKSEEQAKNIKLPIWFGKEISNKITNSMMATMEVDKIKKLLDE